MREQQLISVAQKNGSFQHVAQLANVAWPGIAQERFLHGLGQARRLAL
jgi:hypothetical protein